MATQPLTSESVSGGHPDKLADQVSDGILDHVLRQEADAGHDPARVRAAVEVLVKGDLLVVAGELRAPAGFPDFRAIAEQVARDIGYTDPAYGFDITNCKFVDGMTVQSPDIAQGVDSADDGKVKGAGDQGMMFGYATDETPELMPLPITLAHRLVLRQQELRRGGGGWAWLRPDAKSQVTVATAPDGTAQVTNVVLSTQHDELIDGEPYCHTLRDRVVTGIITPVLAAAGLDLPSGKDSILVNPTGKFITGGPQADTGLTGRKIIVDTYGGAVPHGGGAFSGKDPSKVDRSAAYAARHIAKNIVAAGQAKRCLVQLSYAIGHEQPVNVHVDTCGTCPRGDDWLRQRVQGNFDLSPQGIIDRLRLFQPIYRQTAAYGHFGRTDADLPWEDVAQAHELFGD